MKLAKRVIAKSTPTTIVGAWDADYVYYNPPSSLKWDTRTVVNLGTVGTTTIDTVPTGVYISPDNTKLYLVGVTNDRVTLRSLSPNLLAEAPAVASFKAVGTEETNPTGVFFSPDGIYMYVIGSTGDDINQYTLSTAWDVSTAVFTRVSTATLTNPEGTMQGLFFRDDGLMCYTVGDTLDTVRQYSLSTAWNISTMAFVRSSTVTLSTTPVSISFDPTGIKMRVLQRVASTSQFRSFTLSTAWDISTAVLDYTLPTAPAVGLSNVMDAYINPDGTYVYVTDGTAQAIYPYSMGGFDVSAKETTLTGISFKPDGTKMYVYGSVSDAVHQYNLSTAWDVSSAVFSQSFAIADGAPSGLYFRDDGLKLYSIGVSNVREHTLSTAWDISTATFIRVTSVGSTSGETSFRGLYFKPDGTKLFTIGSSTSSVLQYSLSTPWDVSTFTYLGLKSVTPGAYDVFFRPDGKRMFVLSFVTGGSALYPGLIQYDLSTAWDVSTAVFTKYKATEMAAPNGQAFFFKPDGTKMFLTSASKVHQFSIGVA